MKTKNFDLVGSICDYEEGSLSDSDTLKLFSHLIKSGKVWSLQGHYGRTASALIQDGFLTSSGELTEKALQY